MSAHDLPGFTELEDDDLSAYITWLRHNGKSPATVSRCIASLKSFHSLLLSKGAVTHNPAAAPRAGESCSEAAADTYKQGSGAAAGTARVYGHEGLS